VERNLVRPSGPWWDALEAETVAHVAASPYRRVFDPLAGARLASALAPSGHSLQVGTFSVRDLTDRTAYVSQWPVTESELVGTYLRRCLGERSLPSRARSIETRPALYFAGPLRFYNDLAYIDINACYASIFGPAGLDFRYREKGHNGAVGRVPFLDTEHFFESKRCRNLLWGNLLSRRNVVAHDGSLFVRRVRTTRLYSPELAQYVLDTVHAVAREAVRDFPVLSWHTDGAVLPGPEARAFQIWLLDRWGLLSREKARGPGIMFSLNCRAIGAHFTRQLLAGRARIGRPISTLRPVATERLAQLRQHLLNGAPMPAVRAVSRPGCAKCHQPVTGDIRAHMAAHDRAPKVETEWVQTEHRLLTPRTSRRLVCATCGGTFTATKDTIYARGPQCGCAEKTAIG